MRNLSVMMDRAVCCRERKLFPAVTSAIKHDRRVNKLPFAVFCFDIPTAICRPLYESCVTFRRAKARARHNIMAVHI